MATISVSLICRNEAAHLPRWLKAVEPFADQVVAVDSGSSDDTVAMLQEAGAEVAFHEFTGYSNQRNFAATLCTGDWILCLDADEFVDPGLAQALLRLKSGPQPKENAFNILGKVYFFGKWLQHGGFFPEKNLRLHRRGLASWARNQVHERLEPQGGIGVIRGGYIEHHSYDNVVDYVARMKSYSEKAARHMHQSGRRAGPLTAWGHSFWNFCNRFLLRMGFLDGFEGYMAARLESTYTLVKYAHLRELNREASR